MTDADNSRETAADLHAYLHDHLSGSDAAITVVRRLRKTHTGTDHGRLFAELDDEFTGERAVLSGMLEALGGSSILSLKRTAGRVAGAVMQIVAGGDDGDLALFRTLEALAIGVQGKRLLWRALERISADLPMDHNRRPFRDLEAQALDQWRRIEEHRAEVARQTFIAA